MRTRWSVTCAVLVIYVYVSPITAERYAIQARQNDGASQSPSDTPTAALSTAGSSRTARSSDNAKSTSGSSATSATGSTSSNAATSSNPAQSSAVSASSMPSTGAPSPSSTAAVNDLSPSNYKGNIYTDPATLPLEPMITPALSVAGVLMMVLGTVLIVYVMNPPVSNAVQGAYFVAALITGIIFGAGSIVFTEVTEGLGCLLGGFCLSMWFLVVKPGGLLALTSQKAIFIAAFSLSIFALSFSRYTRPYGLIGSTSFAGATVVILGIDCFSRAGLKEFWLYLWALNSNLFPLGTTTYPITRGIRVEIAGIILIFLLGIVSQSKLWKVIKERREKKAVERHDRELQREREEEDLGRRLEEGNYRERAQWEAVYGDKDKSKVDVADSGIGTEDPDSVRKFSASIGDTRDLGNYRVETIEMNDLNGYNRVSPSETAMKRESSAHDNATPPVMVAQDDDEIRELNSNGKEVIRKPQRRHSQASMGNSSPYGLLEVPKQCRSTAGKDNDGTKPIRSSMEKSLPPAPEVVPLPFTIPVAEDSDYDDDGSSNVTFAESDQHEASRATRLSGRSILRRLSGRPLLQHSQSEEALVVPHVEDDQASSVAATIDDDGDEVRSRNSTQSNDGLEQEHLKPDTVDRMISSQPLEIPTFSALSGLDSATNATPLKEDETGNKLSNIGDVCPVQITNNISSTSSSELPALNPSGEISKVSTQRTSLISSTDPRKDDSQSQMQNTEARRRSNTAVDTQEKDPTESRPKSTKSLKSIVPSDVSGRHSSKASFSEQLPAKLSKVVMSYRTNEWAKHLDRAEKPELDELKLAEQAAEHSREDQEVETAAPVRVEELRQTPLDAQPPPAPRSASQTLSHGYREQSSIRQSASNTSLQDQLYSQPPRATLTQTFYGITPQRPPPQTPLTHAGPQQSLPLMTRGLRSSSTPLNSQTLLESPLEEGQEATYPSRYTPSPMPSNTLLAKRDHIVRNRYSSLPFTHYPSPAESSVQLTPNDSASAYNYRSSLDDDDDDNMSLSQRRSLIQQQRQQQSTAHLPSQSQMFDAHQPQRYSSASNPDRREAMLASWRESVRQDLAVNQQPNFSVDARRQDLMVEKYQSAVNQQQQAMAVNYRDSVFDQAMRRGDMLDLHKEALRKMQASANKHV
ncbi:MAG: hypothetical protein M1830_009524 [Pleopsidium flavum]|nr:MAG: hypothetical protein M1830_009524 [Pleopsidium flavum]